MDAFLILLGAFCVLLMYRAHALDSWRAAVLLYPLPGLAAWHMGAPWLVPVMIASAAGLFVRDWRRA